MCPYCEVCKAAITEIGEDMLLTPSQISAAHTKEIADTMVALFAEYQARVITDIEDTG